MNFHIMIRLTSIKYFYEVNLWTFNKHYTFSYFHMGSWRDIIPRSGCNGKRFKGQKIVHMTARLFYVLIVISGLMLFITWKARCALYGVKFLLGLVTIGLMEMVLVRSIKGKNVSTLWILFFVFLFATMFLGFKLPVGINLVCVILFKVETPSSGLILVGIFYCQH